MITNWRADYVHRGRCPVKARRFSRTLSTARQAGIMTSDMQTTLPGAIIFVLIQRALAQGITVGGLNS